MVSDFHKQVALAVRAGRDIDAIEQEIIEPLTVPEDEKAALWLYAQVLAERPRIAPVGQQSFMLRNGG